MRNSHTPHNEPRRQRFHAFSAFTRITARCVCPVSKYALAQPPRALRCPRRGRGDGVIDPATRPSRLTEASAPAFKPAWTTSSALVATTAQKGAWRGRVSGGCLRAAPCCTAPKRVALKRINSRGTFPLVATDAADSRRVRLSQHVKSRKNNCRAPRRLTACQTRSEPP